MLEMGLDRNKLDGLCMCKCRSLRALEATAADQNTGAAVTAAAHLGHITSHTVLLRPLVRVYQGILSSVMAIGFFWHAGDAGGPAADGPAADGGNGAYPVRARGDCPTKGLKEGVIGFIRPSKGLSRGRGAQVV